MQTSVYNSDLVIDALVSRVGFKTPTHADYAGKVDCSALDSVSGRYFNDTSFHNTLTIQNIIECQNDPEIDTEAEYTTLLLGMMEANVHKTLSTVLGKSRAKESGLLYKKQANVEYANIANSTDFVGLRFRIADDDIAVTVNNLLLHFDSAKTFTIYLYNEFAGLCEQWQVTTTANKQTIVPIDVKLRYRADEAEGGEWYIGYFQEDLGDAKALDIHPIRNVYCQFNAMGFSAAKTDTLEFDTTGYSTYASLNYGINASVSVYADYTNLIIQNSHLFDELLGLTMASTVLEMMLTSTRSNVIERLGKETTITLNREQNNVTMDTNPYEAGIKSRIRREVATVRNMLFPKRKGLIIA